MWDTEMVRFLRPMIGDISKTAPKYDDTSLNELILLAAQLMQTEMSFSREYVIDIDEFSMVPDPTDRDTRDENFINMVLIKAACIVDHSELRQAAGKSIAIKDGSSSIDLKGNAEARIQILKDGWCKHYNTAKKDYLTGGHGVGVAVVGPFREFAEHYYRDGRYR